MTQDSTQTKSCPHCSKDIPSTAKKCPYCQSDLRSWPRQHPLLALIIFFVAFIAVLSSVGDSSSNSNNATSAASPAPTGPNEARSLGQDAYLRLPGNDDPAQVLCLAPTKAVYDEYGKALLAKDYLGILDLTKVGLFCVHNGSGVKVIDTSVTLTKVRVTRGATDVDSDKVGEAGWSASEWVVVK